jgi:hypothetical protein
LLVAYGNDDGGAGSFSLFDFLDNPLAVLLMIAEIEDDGPERFEDDTDVLDAVDVALGERKLAGIGGTGGLSSISLTFRRPREALRL